MGQPQSVDHGAGSYHSLCATAKLPGQLAACSPALRFSQPTHHLGLDIIRHGAAALAAQAQHSASFQYFDGTAASGIVIPHALELTKAASMLGDKQYRAEKIGESPQNCHGARVLGNASLHWCYLIEIAVLYAEKAKFFEPKFNMQHVAMSKNFCCSVSCSIRCH